MRIKISQKASKQFKKLSKLDAIAISRKIRHIPELLDSNRVVFLVSYPGLFRVRVGDYRIVVVEKSGDCTVVLIAHRREVYKVLRGLEV